jgi:hypothetical protein
MLKTGPKLVCFPLHISYVCYYHACIIVSVTSWHLQWCSKQAGSQDVKKTNEGGEKLGCDGD